MQGMFIIDVTATQRYEMKLLISKTERFIRYYRLLISDNRLITFPKHFIHKQNWNHWFLRYIYIQTYIITINYTNHKRKLFFFLFTPIKYFNQFSPFERDKKSKIIVKYKNPIISSPIIPQRKTRQRNLKRLERRGREIKHARWSQQLRRARVRQGVGGVSCLDRGYEGPRGGKWPSVHVFTSRGCVNEKCSGGKRA